MIYKLIHRPWYWLSQFFDMHPEKMNDYPCQCRLCMDYAAQEGELEMEEGDQI